MRVEASFPGYYIPNVCTKKVPSNYLLEGKEKGHLKVGIR